VENTIYLTPEAMDARIARGQARRIGVEDIQCEEHPAVLALPEMERKIWLLKCQGLEGIEIAAILGIRDDTVCRSLKSIRALLEFLPRFMEQLEKRPILKAKFYAQCKKKNQTTGVKTCKIRILK